MEYLRVYADEAGESHMERVPLAGATTIRDWGPGVAPTEVVETSFLVSSANFAQVTRRNPDIWHNPAQRRFIVPLQGRVSMETSSGDHFEIGPGDVVLAEDLDGKGHRCVGLTEEFSMLYLVLADQPAPSRGPGEAAAGG